MSQGDSLLQDTGILLIYLQYYINRYHRFLLLIVMIMCTRTIVMDSIERDKYSPPC